MHLRLPALLHSQGVRVMDTVIDETLGLQDPPDGVVHEPHDMLTGVPTVYVLVVPDIEPHEVPLKQTPQQQVFTGIASPRRIGKGKGPLRVHRVIDHRDVAGDSNRLYHATRSRNCAGSSDT